MCVCVRICLSMRVRAGVNLLALALASVSARFSIARNDEMNIQIYSTFNYIAKQHPFRKAIIKNNFPSTLEICMSEFNA